MMFGSNGKVSLFLYPDTGYIMSNSYFSFKQFTIWHDKCAMKVGTDGVLLGAWAHVNNCRYILDIGTGSGLIALMVAQRSQAQIDAIDIDKSACEQTESNAGMSPFRERIRVWHLPLDRFVPPGNRMYDLILSNPPYFTSSLKGSDTQRNLARHDESLTLEKLLQKSTTLLQPTGRIALILPFDKKAETESLAKQLKLHITRSTLVCPLPDAPPKRWLAELSAIPETLQESRLVIETSRHQYTEEYRALTKDFYLKM